MNLLQQFYQKLAPRVLQSYMRLLLESKKSKELRLSVIRRYQNSNESKLNPEIREGIKFLKHNKFSAYPYYWTLKYENWLPDLFKDEVHQCYYVIFYGKKMYFPKRFSAREIIWTVRSIYKEQDEKSPHRYLVPEFEIEHDTIIIDTGVAEGNFALSVVEKAKKMYLVECNHEWMEALRLTFAPWQDKVVFIERYLSDSATEQTISIDDFIVPDPKDKYFIKMDIEGYEQLGLLGMKNLVASGVPLKMDICTYHKTNDLAEIQDIISRYKFSWHVSDSFMLFYQNNDVPEFRKVLIRAQK